MEAQWKQTHSSLLSSIWSFHPNFKSSKWNMSECLSPSCCVNKTAGGADSSVSAIKPQQKKKRSKMTSLKEPQYDQLRWHETWWDTRDMMEIRHFCSFHVFVWGRLQPPLHHIWCFQLWRQVTFKSHDSWSRHWFTPSVSGFIHRTTFTPQTTGQTLYRACSWLDAATDVT